MYIYLGTEGVKWGTEKYVLRGEETGDLQRSTVLHMHVNSMEQ